MAEAHQTLLEFSNNLLSDLNNGTITAEGALSACQQYGFLRESLTAKSGQLAEAALQNDEAVLALLKTVFTDTSDKLRELPSFQGAEPDAPLNENEIHSVATLRRVAVTRAREHTTAKLEPYKERRRAFIHELVSKYSSTMPSLTDKQLGSIVDQSLVAAAGEATTLQTKDRFAEMLTASSEVYAGSDISPDQRARLKTTIEEALANHEEYFTTAVAAHKSERELVAAVYENLDLKRPDVLADVVINAAEGQKDAALVRGIKLAQVAQAIERQDTAHPASSRGFFTHGKGVGVTKGLQQAAEGLLSIVGEPVREIIYKEKVNGTLRSLLSSTQQLTDRLGETFVHSAVFTHITQDLTKSLSEKPSTAQAGSVFGDVFSTVFRGPLDPAITQATKERLFDYMELARANANAPRGHNFLPNGMSPWEAFAARSGSGVGGRTSKNQWSIWFPFLSLGILGEQLGNLFSSAIDKTTSFIFYGPFLPQQMSASRRAAGLPTPIMEDLPLLVGLIAVGVVILLFIFPSPFNLPMIANSSRSAAVIDSLYQQEGDQGPPGGGAVDCSKNPTDPLCTFKACVGDCRWPTSGKISQGPNVTCDPKASHASGSDKNGVDIYADGNVAVYTIRSGTILYVNDNCNDNSGELGNGCGQGYGNYVTMRTDDGYTIIYGHLKKAINPAITKGATVPAHVQIGWMDQTGNSSGQHLHFGVLSGGNVLDLLPDTPLSKNEILGCVSNDLRCFLVGKGCPQGSVSAQ